MNKVIEFKGSKGVYAGDCGHCGLMMMHTDTKCPRCLTPYTQPVYICVTCGASVGVLGCQTCKEIANDI